MNIVLAVKSVDEPQAFSCVHRWCGISQRRPNEFPRPVVYCFRRPIQVYLVNIPVAAGFAQCLPLICGVGAWCRRGRAKAKLQIHRGRFEDVVIREGTTVLQLPVGKEEPLVLC